MQHIQQNFPSDVAGHWLWTGGAMALAQAGIPPNIIQAMGHWVSNTFQVYIHQHLVLLAALVYRQSPVGPVTW